jgi:hypothetical protein
LLSTRCDAGRVSGRLVPSNTKAATAPTATAQNTLRQPATSISRLPASGARIGETLTTSMSKAIRRAAAWPVCRSRTTARGITMPAQAPRPCTKRSTTSVWISGASAQPTLAKPNSTSPATSGGLRPYMSDSGP